MGLVGIVLAAAGLAVALLSWWIARSGGVSLGQGAFLLLVAMILLLLGLVSGSLISWLNSVGVPLPDAVLLLAVVLFLLAVLLHQAAAFSRITARARHLAQEVALLRRELEESAAAPAMSERPEKATRPDSSGGRKRESPPSRGRGSRTETGDPP